MHVEGHMWLLLIQAVSLDLSLSPVIPNGIQMVPIAFLHGSIWGWTRIGLFCPMVPEHETAAAHSSLAR